VGVLATAGVQVRASAKGCGGSTSRLHPSVRVNKPRSDRGAVLPCWPEDSDEEPGGPNRRQHPDRNDDHRGHSVDRQAVLRQETCARSALGKDGRWNRAAGDKHTQRNQDQVIEVAKNRYRIGDEIDRAERVADHARGEHLRVPWYPWVPISEVECVHFGLEAPCAFPPRRTEVFKSHVSPAGFAKGA